MYNFKYENRSYRIVSKQTLTLDVLKLLTVFCWNFKVSNMLVGDGNSDGTGVSSGNVTRGCVELSAVMSSLSTSVSNELNLRLFISLKLLFSSSKSDLTDVTLLSEVEDVVTWRRCELVETEDDFATRLVVVLVWELVCNCFKNTQHVYETAFVF